MFVLRVTPPKQWWIIDLISAQCMQIWQSQTGRVWDIGSGGVVVPVSVHFAAVVRLCARGHSCKVLIAGETLVLNYAHGPKVKH